MHFQLPQLSENQALQYINAQSLIAAYQSAVRERKQLRGSMIWRKLRGVSTLIRTSASGGQKSLGAQSPQTLEMYDKFTQRKSVVQARLKSLSERMVEQRKLNRLYRIGRVPNMVVAVLQVLEKAGIAEQFLSVGTHAVYAYESACGVQLASDATATRDLDLLFDTRKRIAFASTLERMDTSLIGVLQKADSTFRVRRDQLQTAVNADGFEVAIIRRQTKDSDPHPLRMSGDEDDFWAVQVSSGEKMLDCRKFEQLVVSTSGEMAIMKTLHPLDFVQIKTSLSQSPSRDPLKRGKDELQARLVQQLWDDYLQHGPQANT